MGLSASCFGCLGPQQQQQQQQADPSMYPARTAHSYALQGPPDFGLGKHFEARKLLGSGVCGSVWLALDALKQKVAIKFLEAPLPAVIRPLLEHEIRIQASLRHINLVECRGLVLTQTHLGLLLEYAAGGHLGTYVQVKLHERDRRLEALQLRGETIRPEDRLVLPEDEARYFFLQVLSAVEYLHSQRIAHRDIKLDNMCLDSSKPARIKLCDFGFSRRWGDADCVMHTQVGTAVYMSPQLVSQLSYDAAKADLYAAGVALFAMLNGSFPYDHSNDLDPSHTDVYAEVQRQHSSYTWRETPNGGQAAIALSSDCQDLLDKILERDDSQRISLAEIKRHPWVCRPLPEPYQQALEAMQLEQQQACSTGAVRQAAVNDGELGRLLDLACAEELAQQDQQDEPLAVLYFQKAGLAGLQGGQQAKKAAHLALPASTETACVHASQLVHGPGNPQQQGNPIPRASDLIKAHDDSSQHCPGGSITTPLELNSDCEADALAAEEAVRCSVSAGTGARASHKSEAEAQDSSQGLSQEGSVAVLAA